MSDKLIQNSLGRAMALALSEALERPGVVPELGQAVAQAVSSFALADVPSVADLESTTFARVRDPLLRTTLAQTLHGTRWLYKLGFVLWAKNECLTAHIRAQIIDYAAICEALLGDTIHTAMTKKILGSDAHLWANAGRRNGGKLHWPSSSEDIREQLRHRPFKWMIDVALAEKIASQSLGVDLHWLRKRRNAVHLAERVARNEQEYLTTSQRAFGVMLKCTEQIGIWSSLHVAA